MRLSSVNRTLPSPPQFYADETDLLLQPGLGAAAVLLKLSGG